MPASSSNLTEIAWEEMYSTDSRHLIEEFFAPALSRSVRYDRAVGYFSSGILAVAGREMAEFAIRGGKARLVCSPYLSFTDFDLIIQSQNTSAASTDIALSELKRLYEDEKTSNLSSLFSALILSGCLTIKFAFGRYDGGLFHDKVGVFIDGAANSVAFVGSANETFSAWHPERNHESFEVFTSWSHDRRRVLNRRQYFADLWMNLRPGVEVRKPDKSFRDKCREFVPRAPLEYLEMVSKQEARSVSKDSAPPVERFTLFPHQQEVLIAWEDNECQGIVKHATGSGKTVTALQAIRKWLERGRPCLIVVPSVLLLEQWRREVEAELRDLDPDILLAGGGHDFWKKPAILTAFLGEESPTVTLATIQTASQRSFLTSMGKPANLLMVVDEVHRAGAPSLRAIFEVESRGRLGLSATPERYGDPDGTTAIFNYFGSILRPEFSIRDAIKAGRLCPYVYEVELVHLSDDEEAAWINITKKISTLYARLKDSGPSESLQAQLDQALIRRARIAKKAEGKSPQACQIVLNEYQAGEHWLVYCEDTEQLDDLGARLSEADMPYLRYHTRMADDGEETLRRFRRNGGVLLAIGCLDEGIDMPEITHAVILASSRNPRQYIQRRGRVLRSFPGKYSATVFDLLVLPRVIGQVDREMDSLVIGEITRAREFAEDASNLGVSALLRSIAIDAGMSEEDFDGLSISVGQEDEDMEVSVEE